MSSYQELLAQRAQLDAQIEELRESEREQVIADIRQKLIDYQITIDELGDKKKVKAPGKKSIAAKYYDANTGKSWTGRGKPPAWIKDVADRDVFLIK